MKKQEKQEAKTLNNKVIRLFKGKTHREARLVLELCLKQLECESIIN